MGDELTFGEWLGDQLSERGLQQGDLATRLGVDPSTVSLWVSGKNRPSERSCDLIAAVLQVDPNVVRNRAGRRPWPEGNARARTIHTPSGQTPLRALQVVFIPIIGIAPADSSRWASEVGGALPMAAGEAEGLADPAIVIASGDCMTGRGIQTGDHVLIDRQAVPEPGDVVMMRVGDDFSLKEWWPEGDDYVILRPAAPGYAPIRIRRDQEDAEVIGVARKRIRVTDV